MKQKLTGVVTQFKGNGRKLGYPTANLTTETDLDDGVYFGYADLADFKHYPSLIFVGIPTTMGDMIRRIEVHLLDIPDEDYYGQDLVAYAEHYYRANQTFGSVDELMVVMKGDDIAARNWFKNRTIA